MSSPLAYTLNAEYNRMIAAGTHGTTCENCEQDLAGKQVSPLDCWRCPTCAKEFLGDSDEADYNPRAYSCERHEARALGFTALD